MDLLRNRDNFCMLYWIKKQLIFDLQKIYSNQNGSFGQIKEEKGLKKSSHNYKRKKNRKEPELFRKNYLQIK